MPRQLNSRSIASNAITGDHIHSGTVDTDHIATDAVTVDKIATNAVTADKIAAGAVEQSDINSSVVLGAKGEIHGFTLDGATGNLLVTSGVTELFDAQLNDLYDATIVGTDDMTFSVNSNGHLIMTIG